MQLFQQTIATNNCYLKVSGSGWVGVAAREWALVGMGWRGLSAEQWVGGGSHATFLIAGLHLLHRSFVCCVCPSLCFADMPRAFSNVQAQRCVFPSFTLCDGCGLRFCTTTSFEDHVTTCPGFRLAVRRRQAIPMDFAHARLVSLVDVGVRSTSPARERRAPIVSQMFKREENSSSPAEQLRRSRSRTRSPPNRSAQRAGHDPASLPTSQHSRSLFSVLCLKRRREL